MYGNKAFEDLTESERQNISALAQIAAAVAGGLAGDSSSDAAQGAIAGKNAVENNYLTQKQADEIISKRDAIIRGIGTCRTAECVEQGTLALEELIEELREEYVQISKQQDEELAKICTADPTSPACTNALKDAIAYNGGVNSNIIFSRNLLDDRFYSTNNTLNILYNSDKAQDLIKERVNSIDNRADFFGMNNYYYNELGIPIRWFGAAEDVSRAGITGLGADGNWSYGTFWLGSALTGNWGGNLYDWRNEAGNTLMQGGFDNFSGLYNGNFSGTLVKDWDINQLKNEQSMLQPIHEKYLKNETLFNLMGEGTTWLLYKGNSVDLLDYKSRINFGCYSMGYSKEQGCEP